MKALLAPFVATELNVTDGDTVKVRVPAWSAFIGANLRSDGPSQGAHV